MRVFPFLFGCRATTRHCAREGAWGFRVSFERTRTVASPDGANQKKGSDHNIATQDRDTRLLRREASGARERLEPLLELRLVALLLRRVEDEQEPCTVGTHLNVSVRMNSLRHPEAASAVSNGR